MATTESKDVGVLVKQRDLVYERLRIRCWFNEDRNKLRKYVIRRTRWRYSGRFYPPEVV